uniref:Tyrosine-specific transport protein n=1 Tax=Kalanchoe fedtschenkoi TaxID=63787 RepID=A0A7N0VK48_KALFE
MIVNSILTQKRFRLRFCCCPLRHQPRQAPRPSISHPPLHTHHLNLTSTYFPTTERCLHSHYSKVQITHLEDDNNNKPEKKFWAAVSLIVGTAVGPGMLGLPALTIRSGPLPSTLAILLSWLYVISSILLVAELSFAVMEEDGVEEVSFTGLATKTLGSYFGAVVAIIYASLSFALLVACVSGIGSIVTQCFPGTNSLISNSLIPVFVGSIIWFFPFNAIDSANRLLCFLMMCSITALVIVGSSVARINVLASFRNASWAPSAILPAIPVTVLTLGFHVITPFVCRTAGRTIYEARKAILVGGSLPLVMVLLWNVIVLGLAGTTIESSVRDPISLLLSVSPSALSAVQGFAFSALATSLIGYSMSFPKQILDTFHLIVGISNLTSVSSQIVCRNGRVGDARYSVGSQSGHTGQVTFLEPSGSSPKSKHTISDSTASRMIVLPVVLAFSVFIASCFPSTFSRAIDFAGVYANSFLFGLLPPVMAYIYRCRQKVRSVVLPGGNYTLLLLFAVASILAIWH